MALLLAPYNEAMRIGMGFNSYTQQLCVNDVVRKQGKVRATDADLQPVEEKQASPTAGLNEELRPLSKDSGTIVRTHSDGSQAGVSQTVSWDAGFVDNLSDVSNYLNISGALTITCAAIGGGGGAEAHFVDSTKFIKSDARYSIQVKVTNQRLIASDVTTFCPIPNIPASKFNEVYGDSFISGFIEGGVLSALVLKKLKQKGDYKNMGGKLSVDIDLQAAKISGSAKGDKVDVNDETNTETTITISWSGGGDIKPDDIGDWNISTLTKVAMEFPDKVAICKLSKPVFNALKALKELILKDVKNGKAIMKLRNVNEKLLTYREDVRKDYDKRLAKFNEYSSALQKSAAYNSLISVEEPLPPNKVEPYPCDQFGLDKALQDCRFEMIKIVREVNDVTSDPKVAIDPTRSLRYLSPYIFQLLLPTDKEPLPSPEEIAKMKADLENKIQECAQQQSKLIDAQQEKNRLLEEKKSVEEKLSDEQSRAISGVQESADSTVREREVREKLSISEKSLEKLEERLQNQEIMSKNTLEKALEEAEESKAQLGGRISSLEKAAVMSDEKAEKFQDKLKAAESENTQLQTRVSKAETDLRNSSQEAARVKQELAQLRSELNSGPEILILNIIWGDRQFLWEPEVKDKVLMYAQNNREFTWDNDFFCGIDPKERVFKNGYIAYWKRGKAPVILVGNERTQGRFR
ncbi:hypothetical protein CTAM01_03751 [Colletotrichum tamarilloi]|uniref:Uncharacterized protein n=1 Tax=Colletotrichum tamarilloi TaxID=1209934 RepID=A0ABQ9RIE1_9PEZI|nr:uncharacterized protein CTAM01_03751 [Colletotrichum tamarilloi]KAK1504444.1 hypothetical protein CTAM01_03751 [Colletotrichum tamarilloi]